MDFPDKLRDINVGLSTSRAKLNTLPCRGPENVFEPQNVLQSTKNGNQRLTGDSQQLPPYGHIPNNVDLITRAIGSAASKRLTQKEILEWIKDNFPCLSNQFYSYLISYTLAVDERFLRIPRDGGQDSWWVMNPAYSMDISCYVKPQESDIKRVDPLRRPGIKVHNDNKPYTHSSRPPTLHSISQNPMHTNSPMSTDFRQPVSRASEVTIQKNLRQQQCGCKPCSSWPAQPAPPPPFHPNNIQPTNYYASGLPPQAYSNLANQPSSSAYDGFLPNAVTTTSLTDQIAKDSWDSVESYANSVLNDFNIELLQSGLERNIEPLKPQETKMDGQLDVNTSLGSQSVFNNNLTGA